MKFVAVPGTKVLFSIWATRVRDYEAFCRATAVVPVNPDFERTPDHPMGNTTWDEATQFCAWLTENERQSGVIRSGQEYRLPTDAEWSTAVGLEHEMGRTPAERSGRVAGVYPWGGEWPPPRRAGNYCDVSFHNKYREAYKLQPDASIAGYDDGFADTAPVGSFAPNRFGLYDMGGNVWQWCEDWFDDSHDARVLRGASFTAVDPKRLLSSFRYSLPPKTRYVNYGFRCVLTTAHP